MKIITRRCRSCFAEFTTKRSNQYYCSPRCAKRASSRRSHIRNSHGQMPTVEDTLPKCWRPQAGETITGTLKAALTANTRYGPREFVTIETKRWGVLAVWLTPVVLRRKWDKAQPHIGDTLTVTYEGCLPTYEGNACKIFQLHVEPRQADSINKRQLLGIRLREALANRDAARVMA